VFDCSLFDARRQSKIGSTTSSFAVDPCPVTENPSSEVIMTTVSTDLDTSAGDVWIWSFGAALLRRRYLIVLMALGFGLVVGAATYLRPRQYVASASFIPQEPNTTQPGVTALAAQFGIAAPRASATSPQFYADLLTSRDVLRELLSTRYSVPGFTGTLFEYVRVSEPNTPFATPKAADKLLDLLTVRTNRTTGVVSVEVHTRYPELSVQVIRRMLELVNDYNLKRRQSQGRAERAFTEQRLTAAHQALTDAEERLADFHSANRSYEGSPELRAQQARLQRQVVMRQELYMSLSQNYEAAKIEELRSTPVTTVIENPEGYVQPKPRGTVGKTLLALLAGGVLGVVLAFALEVLIRAQKGRTADFQEFAALWRDTVADLRRPFRRSVHRGQRTQVM
jgi:uncharacterized protein involved in exopolysaccharide biosynthesis